MNHVCVLMSTYNGASYLKTQIDSILNQKNVIVELLVRDDSSSDNTPMILQEYQDQGLLEWFRGDNIGSAKSFWNVLMNANRADYYAFADQDDYWLEDKLIRAINMIESKKTAAPILYFSDKTIVDSELEALGIKDEYIRGVDLQYSLLRGFAAGCTMVFNYALFSELISYKPEVMTMHDSWVLKVAGAVGEIIYDKESYILYRQHDNNTIGNQTRYKSCIRHLKKFSQYRNDDSRVIMAKQLVDNYHERMSQRDVYYTMLLSKARTSISSRLRMVFSSYYKTQNRTDIIAFKFFFLLGWV